MSKDASVPDPRQGPRRTDTLDAAEPALRTLANRPGRRIGIFLDYDGTLTPIVRHADLAVLDDETRQVLKRLAAVVPVAIISGRDLDDVDQKIGVPGIWFAGSHGFDLRAPNGSRQTIAGAAPFLPDLDDAEESLRMRLEGVDGAWVERKRFGLAAHYREVASADEGCVHAAVQAVHRDVSRLRMRQGKKVLELQPDVDWDKGAALRHVAESLGLDPEKDVLIYIGDDDTDEDAFRVIEANGVGILVRDVESEPRPTYARYALDGTDAVHRFLERLAGALVPQEAPETG